MAVVGILATLAGSQASGLSPSFLTPFSRGVSPALMSHSVFQTVEEIEGVLGRDLYPNLAEERSRWEKELAGLREENESLTAMLCSKEEELNRTKATMNAIREERDRLRRRVSLQPGTAWVWDGMGGQGEQKEPYGFSVLGLSSSEVVHKSSSKQILRSRAQIVNLPFSGILNLRDGKIMSGQPVSICSPGMCFFH